MDKGELFCIESDKIASHSDIPAWCHFTGNKLLKAEKDENPPLDRRDACPTSRSGVSPDRFSGMYRFYVEKMAKKGKVAVNDE